LPGSAVFWMRSGLIRITDSMRPTRPRTAALRHSTSITTARTGVSHSLPAGRSSSLQHGSKSRGAVRPEYSTTCSTQGL